YAAVAACKWADEIVQDAPYNTTVEILQQHNIDFCVHGDDITTMADGTDCYQAVKDAGLYRECKRTLGVSTTELVGRMLLMTRDHHRPLTSLEPLAPFGNHARLMSTRRIVQFSEAKEPRPSDRVVYVDGTFDLFHVGHVEFLKRAKELGDFLIVGIHDDRTYVDEVIIGAPYSVTQEILKGEYKVSIVANGVGHVEQDINGKDPYELPKKYGIYKQIETPKSTVTTEDIIYRIIENRKIYEERQRRKKAKAELERETIDVLPARSGK
ncbi:Ethanolamine-phosphate cytidylyltransferase, partial [Rhizopus stolonifer]